MTKTTIKFPTEDYKNYIEYIQGYCQRKGFSLILKGSLATGTAKKNSDIDLVVLGSISNEDMDNIISGYGKPVMTNFTEKPKGIFILVYKNGICVDLDMRNTIIEKDLEDCVILNKNENNFLLSDHISRITDIESKWMPSRPEWYKTLRLLHRGLIKFLCGKTDAALELLSEIKESLDCIDIKLDCVGVKPDCIDIKLNCAGINIKEADLKEADFIEKADFEADFNDSFKKDMVEIFNCIDNKYDVGYEIRELFGELFKGLV